MKDIPPTKVPLKNSIKLSDFENITWEVKDSSKKSFPGDHSAVLFIIATFVSYYARKWYAFFAITTALIFVIPRLVGGGHWFTDVFIGGGILTLITLSTAIIPKFQTSALSILSRPALFILFVTNKIFSSYQKRSYLDV